MDFWDRFMLWLTRMALTLGTLFLLVMAVATTLWHAYEITAVYLAVGAFFALITWHLWRLR